MAQELGDQVKLQSPVYRIDQTGDMVVVETLDKQTYKVSISKEYYGSASAIHWCKVTHGAFTQVLDRSIFLSHLYFN